MGSINDAHQQDGGVLLFSGELVLLFCDGVNCEVKGKGHAKGRIFLTTHRIVFTASSQTQNPNLRSFSAPFFSMYDLALDQPVFGANAIKGKVRGQNEFAFELKFSKGGAIEFGQAMRNAAKQAHANSQQAAYQPPPSFSSPDPSSYYQTPVNNVFQPNYPVGFTLPTQTFSQPPPPGFIYACDVPPPYPGMVSGAAAVFTAAMPGVAVAPDPASLVLGGTSIQPAVYPQAASAVFHNIPMNQQQMQNGSFPMQPGFNVSPASDNPPSYDEATKKKQ